MTTKYDELQLFFKRLSRDTAALLGFGAAALFSPPKDNMTVEQRREWDRAVDAAMRKRTLKKDVYSILQKTEKGHAPVPPRQGLVWDAAKSRWTNPDNVGKTVTEVQGRKRIRGTGTGVHEHALASGAGGKGGKGGSLVAGRRFRSAEDTASPRTAQTFAARRAPTRRKAAPKSRGSALARYKAKD